MVRFQRSLVPMIGKFPEAVEFAKQITNYVKGKYKTDTRVYTQSDGTLYWITNYEDFDAFGRIRTQIVTDKEYWSMVEKASNLFVEGSVEDILLTPID